MPLMQQSAKIPFGGTRFLGLLKLSLEVVKNTFVRIYSWSKNLKHADVLCKINVPFILGNFSCGGEPQTTARIDSLWLLSAAVNQN